MAGCSGDRAESDADTPAGAATVSRTDSAGITVLRLDLSHPMDRMAVDTIARVGLDPGGALYRVSGAAFVADSLLVVGDGGGATLRRFGEDGRWIDDVGRPGEGPGEFSNFISVHPAPGDSVAVSDFLQRRITFFSPDGTPGRTLSTSDLGPNVNLACVRSDGRAVVTETHLGSLEPNAVSFDSLAVVETDGAGGVSLLAHQRSRQVYFHQTEGRPPAIDDLPFAPHGTATCADEAVALSSPLHPAVRVEGAAGVERMRIVRSDPNPTIPADTIRLWRARMDTSVMFAEWADHVPVPNRFPPFTGARLIPGDRMVLEWRDADGRHRRGLLDLARDRFWSLSAGGEVIGASETDLAIVERDTLDVESVLWVRLSR